MLDSAFLLEYLIILSRYYYLISLANLVDSHVIVPLSLFVPLHTFMATSSLSAGLQTPIGYGPMLASAAQSIPEFEGDRKTFADFDFKLKAVAYDLGLDDLLLRPQEWQASHRALQQRVERAGSHATTRSASSSATDPSILAESTQLQKEVGNSKLLARLIIGKLKGNVTQLLRDSLPEKDHFDPIAIYAFLRAQFSVSEEAKKVQENPEAILLEILSKQWAGIPLLNYVRNVHQKLKIVFLCPKFSRDDVQRALMSLIVKHVLNQVRSRPNSVFEPLLQQFMPRVLSTRDLLAADTMQELVAEVERISLLHPVDHERYDRRDNKPKPKPGAASAAPGGGKVLEYLIPVLLVWIPNLVIGSRDSVHCSF